LFPTTRTPYPDWWFKAVNYTNGPPPVPKGARYTGEIVESFENTTSPHCTADAVITCVRQCNKDDVKFYTGCVDKCVHLC
jgi:hypothetical protein